VPRKRTHAVANEEKAIGTRLRELRRRRGKIQTELAAAARCRSEPNSSYERGTVRPHPTALITLARLLCTSTDHLLSVKPMERPNGAPDRRFARRLEKLARLPKRDQLALLRTIDAFMAKVS
jgi:hypothetical protein